MSLPRYKLIAVFVMLLLALFAIGGSRFETWAGDIDSEGIKPTPYFLMADGHIGTIVKSTEKDQVGQKITFTGLRGDNPKIIFEGGGTSPLRKVYESDETVTLILVASGSGSVDAFVIDKKSGLFSRAFAGSVLGVYSGGSIGVLK